MDILREGTMSQVKMKSMGYRNACSVLYRFRLIELTSAGEYRISECRITGCSSIKAVWEEAGKEASLKLVINKIKENCRITPNRNWGICWQKF
jgi:hypothetical protein